jgi:hypothetical protein
MIRQPSSENSLLSWHRAAMSGENTYRHDGDPQCGWYKMQAVKNGPWEPVTIWCDQEIDPDTGELTAPEMMRADVFGEERPADEVWLWLTPISRDEFDRLYQWRLSNQHRLESRRSIDLAQTPTLPGA